MLDVAAEAAQRQTGDNVEGGWLPYYPQYPAGGKATNPTLYPFRYPMPFSNNDNSHKVDPSLVMILTAAVLFWSAVLAFFVPSLAVVVVFAGIIAFAFYLNYVNISGVTDAEEDFAAQVRRRLDHCKAQEDHFRDEAEAVRRSIRALRDDLEDAPAEWTAEHAQAKTTLADLKAEFNLRHVKALFFADCATRLQEMLGRYQLRQSIQARRDELRRLRRTNHDVEADMEETRYHLERDAAQLEAIAELSREAVGDFQAERAEELRARLEELRRKISTGAQPSPPEKS